MQINLRLPLGLHGTRTVFKYDEMTFDNASTPLIEQVELFALKDFCPTDTRIEAALTYQQQRGKGKAGQESWLFRSQVIESAPVPASMFMCPIEPSKDSLASQMTFVLQGSHTLPSLPDIFTDLLQGSDAFSKERRNVSWATHDGARASIVVSKDCTKLKLQADALDKHWLVMSQLFPRLESHFNDG